MGEKRYFLFILALALAYFAPNIWRGGVLLPLDILYHQGPFSASIPEELHRVRNPHLSDLITIYYPWTEFLKTSGAIVPLWNPYSFCGSPLLANAQNGFLFPLSWLYRILPLDIASVLVALLKMVFCGTFAFLFYRRMGCESLACLLGAVCYMLGGHLVVWFGYPTAFPLVTLPFLFWAIERYLSSLALGDLSWISLAYGLLFIGGQPQTGFVIALASMLYFLIRSRACAGNRSRARLSFLASSFLGLCLAAPQILPFLEYLGQSAAYSVRGSFGWKLYPWFTLISWIMPRFFGDLREGNFWGFSSLLGEAVYVGAFPLILAILGVALARKGSIFWAMFSVFIFGFAGLYLPFVDRAYLTVPLLSSLDNNKLMVLVGFGLSSMAVLGLNEVMKPGADRGKIFGILLGASGLWLAFVGFGAWNFREAIFALEVQAFEAREASFHAGCLLLGLGLVFLWKRRTLESVPLAVLLLLLTTGDLLRVWINYYPSYPEKYARPFSPSLEFLEERSGGHRVLGLSGFLPPETSVLYRLEDARGYDGLTPWTYYQVLGKIDPGVQDLGERLRRAEPQTGAWTSTTLFYRSIEKYARTSDPDLRAMLTRLDYWSSDISRLERPHLLSVLGVRHVLSPKGNPVPAAAGLRLVHSSDAEVWENPDVLPRAFVVARPVFVQSEEAALEAISDPGFPLQRAAVIETDAPQETWAGAAGQLIAARITKYSPHVVELEAESDTGGWLVLSDLYYPGWKAYVGSSRATIFHANYLFRAVKIPAGKHRVCFVYRPGSFYLGVILAVLAAAVLVVLRMVSRKRFQTAAPDRAASVNERMSAPSRSRL